MANAFIRSIGGLLAITLLLAGAARAQASIMGELWINQSVAAGDATIARAAGLGTPDAQFVPGAIAFNSTVTGYTIAEFLNHPTFTNTSVAFDPNATADNTYYLFTGNVFLNAGANSFVIPHDDGLQLNIDGIGLVVDQPGPTAPVSTPFTVTAPSAGSYNFELSYGECCGPPAELAWDINGSAVSGAVPLPATAWSGLSLILGLGVFGVARQVRQILAVK